MYVYMLNIYVYIYVCVCVCVNTCNNGCMMVDSLVNYITYTSDLVVFSSNMAGLFYTLLQNKLQMMMMFIGKQA